MKEYTPPEEEHRMRWLWGRLWCSRRCRGGWRTCPGPWPHPQPADLAGRSPLSHTRSRTGKRRENYIRIQTYRKDTFPVMFKYNKSRLSIHAWYPLLSRKRNVKDYFFVFVIYKTKNFGEHHFFHLITSFNSSLLAPNKINWIASHTHTHTHTRTNKQTNTTHIHIHLKIQRRANSYSLFHFIISSHKAFNRLPVFVLYWASKETYHFFRATLTKIHFIKINNIWTQISFNTP